MITFPKSKINLGLRITGKRPDGYHDIETVFYPVPLSDALEFVESDGAHDYDKLVVTGINISGSPDNNLVIRAIRKLRESYDLPYFRIHLHKAIPTGAGLGGGSSDAAIILKALNRCYGLSIDPETLKKYALDLGSDCPFFLNPVPSLACGRGEMLRPLSLFLQGYYIILLNPGIKISTREAYINCHPAKPEKSLETYLDEKPSLWKNTIFNDFEEYAFKLYPEIRELKEKLYEEGAFYSSMSGSGSSVYGIFEQKPEISAKLRKHLIFEGKL
jgi:4-diphosphocytidyl-2-C-methyl-D-erythritol kinase